MSSTGAVSSAAVDLADKLNAKAIVAYTQTGATVHRVSRERPAAPIYGLTSNEHTYHWLALSWGTEAFLLKEDYHDKSRKLRAITSRAALTPSTCTPLALATDFRLLVAADS